MLGRAMEPDLLSRDSVPLGEFLSSVLEAVRVLAPRRFELVGHPDLVIDADREQLRGAIVNLLENSIHATTDGQQITLGATRDEASGGSRSSSRTQVRGSPQSRASALQRFARPGARDEDGSGLGLAIAKAVRSRTAAPYRSTSPSSWEVPEYRSSSRPRRLSRRWRSRCTS